MDNSRRGFLAKIGVMATAPVLTAFIPDAATGLAVPNREIEVVKEPLSEMVIASRLGPPMFHAGDRMRPPNGTITFIQDGQAWGVLAYRIKSPGDGTVRP